MLKAQDVVPEFRFRHVLGVRFLVFFRIVLLERLHERRKTMRDWAEKRRHEMERIGSAELARMFELVARLCQMEEEAAGMKDERILLPMRIFQARY